MSYAGLVYAGDTSDPARAKFYGDAQENVTALAGDLLFFELELNRLDDALIDAAMADPRARPLSPLARGHPQGDARTSSPTRSSNCSSKNRSAARRRGTGCSTTRSPRCASNSRASELTLEPLLAKLQDPDETKREAAANALGETLGANLRVFALITNTLAKDKEISDRWRKFDDIADSRHLANRVEREVVEAMVAGGDARAIRASRIATTS